jgi:serine/threonine protein kinase
VIHRDIKSANLLRMKDGTVKLCDFGQSRFMTSQDARSTMSLDKGTPAYASPEILRGQKYEETVDILCLARTIMALLLGRHAPMRGRPPSSFPKVHRHRCLPARGQ